MMPETLLLHFSQIFNVSKVEAEKIMKECIGAYDSEAEDED